MTSLQNKLKTIRDALVEGLTEYNEGEAEGTLLCDIFHYWRPHMTAPFVVWAEDGEANSFDADDRKREQVLTGYVDFYTRTEFDPIADKIQTALFGLQDRPFTWRLEAVDYEDDTNLIHYQWTWEVA